MAKIDFQSIKEVLKVLDDVATRYSNDDLLLHSSETVHTESVHIFIPLSAYVQRAPPVFISEMAAAISKSVDLLEKMKVGILQRFIDELKLKNKVASQNFLKVIMALETLFMEWSCDQRVQESLILVGVVYLLFQQLQLLQRLLNVDRIMKKYIFAAALTISNCIQNNMDLYMCFHPNTPILSILEPYFGNSDLLISSCTKFIRNNFSWYLHKSDPQAIDCCSHISELMDLLLQSFSPTPLSASSISLEPMEILHMLEQLSVNEKNRKAIICHSKLVEVMSHLLQGKDQKKDSIIGSFNLLLGILSPFSIPPLKAGKAKGVKPNPEKKKEEIDYRSMLLESLPHLVPWLKDVDCQSSDDLKELRDALLHLLQEKPVSSIQRMAGQCFQYKHYELVVLLASQANDCSLLEMKARYELYCREQILLQQKEKEFRTYELKRERQLLYGEARKIVPALIKCDLGNREIRKMLDNMLIDIVRDLNEQSGIRSKKGNTFFNCLLCHKPDGLARGHFWAKSHIIAIRGSDKKFFKDRASLHREPQKKEVSQLIYYMFCHTCDNEILSVDENLFSINIICVIYPQLNSLLPAEEHVIPYKGNWLYRFCLALVFRCFCLLKNFNSYSNSEVAYKVFEAIRSILLAKSDEVEVEYPTVLMFFTPTSVAVDEEESGKEEAEPFSILAGVSDGKEKGAVKRISKKCLDPNDLAKMIQESSSILDEPLYIDGSDFSRVSYMSLYERQVRNQRRAHFMLNKQGIFNIVVLVEKEVIKPEHQDFVISPKGGTLHIPPNDVRMSTLPPAILQTYKERVPRILVDLLESDPKVSELNSMLKISCMDPHMPSPSSVLPLQINSTVEYNINLLPIKHYIDRNRNLLQLPPNHSVLLHCTQHGETTCSGRTVILALNDKNRPYSIIHSYKPNMLISLGYYVSSEDFSFTGRLENESHKGMELLVQENDDLIGLAAQLIPLTLHDIGLVDYNFLLLCHQAGICVDRKCVPGLGCWYCSLSCEICRKPHMFGSIVKLINDVVFKFCSQDCLNFYHKVFDDLTMMKDIKPPDSEENSDSTTASQDFNQDKGALGDGNTSENVKETKKGDDESLIEMAYNKTLTSSIVNEVISQMNNAVLIMNIICTFETHNSLKAQATIKIFHTSAEGILYVPVAPNTYLMVSYLQLAFEQYIDVYCVANDGSLLERIYPRNDDSLKSHDIFSSLSQRKIFLACNLREALGDINIKDLSNLAK